MKELTAFQNKCKEELCRKLRPFGLTLKDIVVLESDETWFWKKEVFLEASVENLNIWIYEDGAHIRYKNVNFPFEIQDYKTEEKIIHAFVEKVISLISKIT